MFGRISRRAAIGLMAVGLFLAGTGLRAAVTADDPLVAAKAVADRELFGRVILDDGERPEVVVHHDWMWLDSTLMAAVFALYERTEEVGSPVPRYLDYLEAWGAHDLGGYPVPIIHGDMVCAGQAYIWLYERSGRTSDHLAQTDGMIDFIFKARGRASQWFTPYHSYWMRFWQDDMHMIPPFLAQRGRAAGGQGVPGGKDARAVAVDYCRAYHDVLGDPATGLFWHNPRAKGEYFWGRGNGWVAAGYYKVMKILEQDPAYADDAAWLRERLMVMAATLRDSRNPVGTWNASIMNQQEYTAPETSGSAFFTYMMAGMINSGYLGDDYVPVVQKAWHFLALSVGDEGDLMRVQPTGRGPIKDDFEMNSETYGVGGFILAGVEMSKMPREVLERAASVECVKVSAGDLDRSGGVIALSRLRELGPNFPSDPAVGIQAVVAGRRLPETKADVAAGTVTLTPAPAETDRDWFIFYRP